MDMQGSTIKSPPRKAKARPSPAPAQDWKLLQLFNIYRLVISAAALSIALFAGIMPPFGTADQGLFLYASLTYFIVSLFGVEITRSRKPDCDTQTGVFAFADITFLTLLIHASGGLKSGLGLLLIVAIVGVSLILGKRMTVFFAALATIATLLQHTWGVLTSNIPLSTVAGGLPQAGMLGIGLLAISGLSNGLARRLRVTEALAERRGTDLVNLANVNEQIIRRMQTGVLACDTRGHIGMINERARVFLGIPETEKNKPQLASIAPELLDTLKQWLENPGGQLKKPFRSKPGYVLLPRFVMLGKKQRSAILIFIDNTALLKQQAQQLKIAALARLTASIAHEIRNPLGAISNAAQLLGESTDRHADDQRLVQIIQDHARRMNVIVENITQLGRRDRVNQLPLRLAVWVQEFIEQYTEHAKLQAEAISWSGPQDLVVCVDPDQLYQVVVNLCENALRHCPPFTGGEPLIRLHFGTTEDGKPYLEVIDRGSGIPPDIMENIFDPFFTTTPQGTGLGLYIARELCEGNGGGLEHLPGNEVGARFRATLAKAEECGG